MVEARDCGEGVPTLTWTVTPWRHDRRKALLVAGTTGAAAAGAWWFSGGQIFFALLAFVMIWGSVGSFFTTSRYRIDADGVEIDSPFLKRRRAWDEIRSWYLDRHGATLSPFSGTSWLEPYRSIRVLFGTEEETVRSVLSERLGPPGGPVARRPPVD